MYVYFVDTLYFLKLKKNYIKVSIYLRRFSYHVIILNWFRGKSKDGVTYLFTLPVYGPLVIRPALGTP